MIATAFETKEHHITLCLRDESNRLVTTSNLKHRVTSKSELKYASHSGVCYLKLMIGYAHHQ